MKKKVLAVIAAAMVLALGSMSVLAKDSPNSKNVKQSANIDKGTVVESQKASTAIAATATPDEYLSNTKVSDGFSIGATSSDMVTYSTQALQKFILNDIAAFAKAIGNSALETAATDSKQKVTATVLSVVDISPSSATKGADGMYTITLNIASISSGDAIGILHYANSGWETIYPTAVNNGSVTFKTASCSPFAVVKVSLPGTATGKASPKTGEQPSFAILLVCVGLAGALVCKRKFEK